MMQQRLGKGLGALIGSETEKKDLNSVIEVNVNEIDPNMEQPRKRFDDEKLKELAQSIRTYGIVQPIIVQKKDARFIIIAGERRYRAARIAGLDTVPVVIKEYSKSDFMEVSLVENLQREDLNSIEEAQAMQLLMEEHQLTQDLLSSRLGKSRSAIANTLRLLSLPEEIQSMIINGSLTSGHARSLISVNDHGEKIRIAKRIIADGMSVRATEEMIKEIGRMPKQKEKTAPPINEELLYAENTLSTVMGTKVKITGSKKRGCIQISYFNEEQLSSLYDFLMSNQQK